MNCNYKNIILIFLLFVFAIINYKAPRNEHAATVLRNHAARVEKKLGGRFEAARFWLARSERLFRLRREFTLPLNGKVLLQDFLIPWLEI